MGECGTLSRPRAREFALAQARRGRPVSVRNRAMAFDSISRRGLLGAGAALLAPGVFAAPPAAFVTDYETRTGGRAGFYARNAATGRRLAWRAVERFAMCSTFKASLAGLVLARVDQGRERLDRAVAFGPADLLDYAPVAKAHAAAGTMTIETMCAAVVELSDNTCANLLLREIGGPQAMTEFWRAIGDGVSRLDHNEPELNRTRPGELPDTTTPAAMAHTMLQLTNGTVLAPASRERLPAGWFRRRRACASCARACPPTGVPATRRAATAPTRRATWPSRGPLPRAPS